MVKFSIREVEGMRQVRMDIRDETVRARRGAMSNLRGNVSLTPRLPGSGDIFRSMFTKEAVIRPYYSGTGSILLKPSLSGYHVVDVTEGDRWILEPGVYWASEGSVELSMYREPFWAGLWAGDGPFVWKTTLSGHELVAINAPGPVETVEIKDDEMRVQGRLILGRTDGLKFSSQRSAPFPRHFISGQQRLRVFTGTGKALVCWTPYWNEHLLKSVTGEEDNRSPYE